MVVALDEYGRNAVRLQERSICVYTQGALVVLVNFDKLLRVRPNVVRNANARFGTVRSLGKVLLNMSFTL